MGSRTLSRRRLLGSRHRRVRSGHRGHRRASDRGKAGTPGGRPTTDGPRPRTVGDGGLGGRRRREPDTPFLKDDVPGFVVNEGERFELCPASARTKGVCSVRTKRLVGSIARATGRLSRSTGTSCSMSSPIRSSRSRPSWSDETEATCRSCSRPRPSERGTRAHLGWTPPTFIDRSGRQRRPLAVEDRLERVCELLQLRAAQVLQEVLTQPRDMDVHCLPQRRSTFRSECRHGAALVALDDAALHQPLRSS